MSVSAPPAQLNGVKAAAGAASRRHSRRPGGGVGFAAANSKRALREALGLAGALVIVTASFAAPGVTDSDALPLAISSMLSLLSSGANRAHRDTPGSAPKKNV